MTTRNSMTSTQTKHSKPKLNAGEIIGNIIDRFRRSIGWNLKEETQDDRGELVLSFLEILGAANVPVSEYEPCYRQARLMRAEIVKKGKEPPFHLTPEEMAAAWVVRAKKLAESEEKPDLDHNSCKNKHEHIGGEAVAFYQPVGRDGVILPCHECRPKAHEIQRKADKQKYEKEILANRKKLNAPPVIETIKPKIEKVETPKDSGDLCKNCGKKAGKDAVPIWADFKVCAKCHEEVQNADMRRISHKEFEEKLSGDTGK